MTRHRKHPVAVRVTERLDEFERSQTAAKRLKETGTPETERDKWILAWNRQCEVFDGWLKPAVRAGADYQYEYYEVQESLNDRYVMSSRSLIVPPNSVDIIPLAGLSKEGQGIGSWTSCRMGSIHSPAGGYTVFWDPKVDEWGVGRPVVVTIQIDRVEVSEEQRKKAKLPVRPQKSQVPAKLKAMRWNIGPLTVESFGKIIEELV